MAPRNSFPDNRRKLSALVPVQPDDPQLFIPERTNNMKTNTKTISAAFAILLTGAVVANAAPGDLYVAAYGTHTIYRYTPDGNTQTVFTSDLSSPEGLAFDNAGNLFVADTASNTIYQFAPDGTRSTFAATGLSSPVGLAFDNAGNLFEADYGSGTIYKFTPAGAQSTFATGLNGPYALAFDVTGNLFVANYNDGTIKKYAPDGAGNSFAAGLRQPAGLAFSGGYLLEADSSNFSNTIIKFAPDGIGTTFATGLNSPLALIFDGSGNLFEADYGTGQIYKFAPDGTRNPFATGLNGPDALAIQPQLQATFAARIQQPINADGTSVFNVKRGVVPVKFILTQGGSATCTLPSATMALTRTAGSTMGAIDESVYSMSADTGPNFRIDSCQYIYNLSASVLGVGTYRVDIKINGQVVGSAIFALR